MANRHQSAISGLDRILGRVDELDARQLGVLVQRLVRERRLLEEVLNASSQGVLLLDRHATVQYANRTAMDSLSVSGADLVGESLSRLVPELWRAFAKGKHTDAQVFELPSQATQSRLTLHYPFRRVLDSFWMPFKTEQTEPDDMLAYILFFTDVTDREQTRRSKIREGQLSGVMDLAAGVAHELGNPLQTISIQLDLLEKKLKTANGKLEKPLKICRAELGHLDAIVKDFLQAVCSEPLSLKPMNMNELLEERLKELEDWFKQHGIEVMLQEEKALPFVLGDANSLRQLVFNVVKNAVEAMSKNNTLRVETSSSDEAVFISFIDEGNGMETSEVQRVFQPYFSKKMGGVGLGLVICQRIAQDHGGYLSIDSQKHAGTTVTLSLPRQEPRTRMIQES